MITLGRRGDLHARRQALAELRSQEIVHKLFADVAPRMADRPGGYTRIIKIGHRQGDAAEMVYLELVDYDPAARRVRAARYEGGLFVLAGTARKRSPARRVLAASPRVVAILLAVFVLDEPVGLAIVGGGAIEVGEAWLWWRWTHRRRPVVGAEALVGAVGGDGTCRPTAGCA